MSAKKQQNKATIRGRQNPSQERTASFHLPCSSAAFPFFLALMALGLLSCQHSPVYSKDIRQGKTAEANYTSPPVLSPSSHRDCRKVLQMQRLCSCTCSGCSAPSRCHDSGMVPRGFDNAQCSLPEPLLFHWLSLPNLGSPHSCANLASTPRMDASCIQQILQNEK